IVTGIVVSTDVPAPATSGPGGVKAVRDVLDREAFVPPDVVELARWTAEYYAAGVGDAIPMLLPPMARGGRVDAHKTRRVVSITASGMDALDAVTAKQREVLALLSAAPDGVAAAELAGRGFAADVIRRLVKSGYVSVRHTRVERDPYGGRTPVPVPVRVSDPRTLTHEQQEALERLCALAAPGTFRVALVHGVTGSGKTEIYLRLAAAVRDAGRRSLMLVPEIALTPAVADQFRAAFGDRVAIQHSGLADGERHDQWQRIRRGDVDVVVGTRSAVFAPLERVGLIVVDEEHDASYKHEEAPRYSGRDVAIVRAQKAGALVVLGSATPSLETYQHAMTGKYERVVLRRRVLDRPLAAVPVVDMREEYANEGAIILSRALRDAIVTRVGAKEQALVLLNRRGFATAVFCRQCAGTLDCPNCSVSLVIHGEGSARRARCHY